MHLHFNIISPITTTYSFVPSVQLLQPTVVNTQNDIYIHVSISKPTGQCVSRFTINFTYKTALYSGLSIINSILAPSKVTVNDTIDGLYTITQLHYIETIGVDDFLTATDVLLFRFILTVNNASPMTGAYMVLSLPSFELRNSGVQFNLINTVSTLYTYVPDVKLGIQATSLAQEIFFPLAISKPTHQAVSSFSMNLRYTTSLFSNVVIIDNILESRKTTISSIVDGLKTVYTISYTEAGGVDNFMTGSGTILLRFKFIAINASSVTGLDMVMSLTSFVLRDSSVDFNRIATIPITYVYVADVN